MDFNCKVNIVDAICGAGKTQSIIHMINQSDKNDRFIVITPFLEEITRYKENCRSKKFKEPSYDYSKNKKQDFKKLLANGDNIVTTHVMFQNFDNEIIDACRAADYTLVMDEVANVITEHKITKDDYETLMEYTYVNPDTKQLIWKDEYKDYKGRFDKEKYMCELGSLVIFGNSLMVWLFPVSAFNAFRNIYILTYMFNCQLQRYYYDYYKLPYKYLSVAGEFGSHHLIEYDNTVSYIKHDYKKLINIIDDERMNKIGDRQTDLSKAWYERNKNSVAMKVLKNNLNTFFRRIRTDCSNDNLWTTYKDYKEKLKGPGYTKGFLSCNARATNEYKDRSSVAYMINRYINPFIKNFFTTNNIEIDEDSYALSEMLQFIWRSAIRDGKEIWVYIPSIRMRELLKKWITENSLQ